MNGSKTRSSRRTWLKTGLAGVGLLSVGGVGLALQKTKPLPRVPKLEVLDATRYAILVAIADRLCPALGPGAPGAVALGTPEKLDAMLTRVDDEARTAMSAALTILENALPAAIMGERVTPFTSLSPADQDRALDHWRTSSVGFRRTVFGGVANAISSVYWGDARTWARLGYKGPPDRIGLRAAYADQLVDLDSLRATPVAKET